MNFFWTVFTATLRQRLRRVWSWLVLLLIPCLIIGIHLSLPKDAVTAPVQVGVALPQEGGETLWALLEQRSGTVLTFFPADEDTIDRNIASGRWDCGVIVDEDFEALVQDLDTDRIFTLRLGEGSAVYPLVREALSACMASLVTEPIARDYLAGCLKYGIVLAAAWLANGFVCALLPGNIAGFFLAVCVTAILPNLVMLAVFCRTREFGYFAALLRRILAKFGRRSCK